MCEIDGLRKDGGGGEWSGEGLVLERGSSSSHYGLIKLSASTSRVLHIAGFVIAALHKYLVRRNKDLRRELGGRGERCLMFIYNMYRISRNY